MVSEIDVEGKLIIRQDWSIFRDHSHFEQTNNFLSPPHPENKHAIPLTWNADLAIVNGARRKEHNDRSCPKLEMR